MDKLNKPLFIMCPPDYFRIPEPDPVLQYYNEHSIEGWKKYRVDPKGYLEKSTYQWHDLLETIAQRLNANVHLIEPQNELFDQVFAADASLSIKQTSLISAFTHPARQGETHAHHKALQSLFPNRNIVKFESAFEGAGDNVYDCFRDVYWSGYSQDLTHPANGRSSRESHDTLAKITGITVNSIQVKRPYFHVDTCLAPLSKGHILVYKGGMSRASYMSIMYLGCYMFGLDPKTYIIEVTKEEAYDYACNVINVGNQVIIPKTSTRLMNILEKVGYQVSMVDLSHFIMAGGGPHCLVNFINQPRKVAGRMNEVISEENASYA